MKYLFALTLGLVFTIGLSAYAVWGDPVAPSHPVVHYTEYLLVGSLSVGATWVATNRVSVAREA